MIAKFTRACRGLRNKESTQQLLAPVLVFHWKSCFLLKGIVRQKKRQNFDSEKSSYNLYWRRVFNHGIYHRLKACYTTEPNPASRPNWKTWYNFSLLCALGGQLSKSLAVLFFIEVLSPQFCSFVVYVWYILFVWAPTLTTLNACNVPPSRGGLQPR